MVNICYTGFLKVEDTHKYPVKVANGKRLFIGGFLGLLKTMGALPLIHDRLPDKIVYVWDNRHSPRRTGLYRGYKAGRSRGTKNVDPVTYTNRFGESKLYINQAFAALGVDVLEFEYREADDIIYQLSRLIPSNWGSVIFTDDKDYYQMVNKNTRIWRPQQEVYISKNNFEKKDRV